MKLTDEQRERIYEGFENLIKQTTIQEIDDDGDAIYTFTDSDRDDMSYLIVQVIEEAL